MRRRDAFVAPLTLSPECFFALMAPVPAADLHDANGEEDRQDPEANSDADRRHVYAS